MAQFRGVLDANEASDGVWSESWETAQIAGLGCVGQGRSGVFPPIENRHRAKLEKNVLSPGQCTGHSLPRSELLARRTVSLSVGTSFDHGRRELKPCLVLSFRKGQRALGVQFSLSSLALRPHTTVSVFAFTS